MSSSRCRRLCAARRNRPSRRRRSHGCRLRGTSSDTLTSPGCRFLNWLTLTSVSESASQRDESSEDRFERLVPLASHAQPTFTSARRRFCSISFHFEMSALLTFITDPINHTRLSFCSLRALTPSNPRDFLLSLSQWIMLYRVATYGG